MFGISLQNYMTDLNVVRCASIPIFFLNFFLDVLFLVVNPCDMFWKIENNTHL